jgi:1-acyl-sn-glycerol-3-phosphate acyltransferase
MAGRRLVLLSDARRASQGWRWARRPLVPEGVEGEVAEHGRPEFPTGWARSPGGRAAREVVQRLALGPLLTAEVTTEVRGLDVLETVAPPVVFLANHASHLDTPLVLCSLPADWRRRTSVAAAADYFFDTWWRAVGSALVFNTFPLERRGGRPSTTPADVLDGGWNVLVFPEGSRSTDGWLGRVRPGAAYLACAGGVPVVPVCLTGTYAAMPRGRAWPMPGRPRVGVRFGPPVHPQPGEEPRELSIRLQAALDRLIDEDATDWWSASRRAASGETPPASGPVAAPWRRRWTATAPAPANSPSGTAEPPRPWA